MSEETAAFVDTIMMGMSLRQKVGQCFMPTINADGSDATLSRLRFYQDTLWTGGVVLLKGTISGAKRMSEESLISSIPLFVAIDAEWGLGMRLKDAPAFPKNGNISSEATEQLLYDYGEEIAGECREVGINMILGPVIDVTDSRSGIIGNRSFGGDPVRVADLGVAYARGIESGGIISVAKHFPGHGSPEGDSHESKQFIHRTLNQLDSIDLYPFRSYVAAGLSGVMAGHLALPAIDPECLPAAVSRAVITDLLREELGFEGLVLTDALNMRGADGFSATDALLAGADIVIGPADTEEEIRNVLLAIERGEFEEELIDSHCRRILFYKTVFGLFDRIAYPDSLSPDGEELRRRAEIIRQRLSL